VADVVSLMERPVYTYPQVDRLLELSEGTSNRWLNGYRRRSVWYEPILRSEPSDTRWVTWGEFVEARLFAGYRDVDRIDTKQLRVYVQELRRRFNVRYPLAYAAPYVRTEGRRLLWEAQQVAGLPDRFAAEVGSNQIMLAPWVESFVQSVDFDESEGVARKLRPDPDFSDVYVDPLLRGGEPTIAGHNVRVRTVASFVRGGEDPAEVAEWYGLNLDEVRQAVGYDQVHAAIG
jgi:uncharacterized protein (DUF433 family)